MSRMIPGQVVKVLRQFNNLAVDLYGVDAHLYIPKNWEAVENNDVYGKPSDFTWDEFDTKVWIEWTPNKYKLQKYGLYVEENIPILAYFSNKLKDVSGFEYTTEILARSWFTLPLEYVPSTYGTSNFEIVDVLVPKMHDAVILKAYKIAPKRTK